ncbi:FecCD family ABC transporter permease [Paraferrimonas haliotis]|uniref:ABC transporter permease n=1 Tax=Paraferrimonas haliotis TaxID=2013866 RepID=A0AA37TLT9_9GAMM|nr:iron ABC transporter permease [Paraferrimonas haliotis]GLS83609.1 ABC transporter permease [Paraferrimonas haliotis]
MAKAKKALNDTPPWLWPTLLLASLLVPFAAISVGSLSIPITEVMMTLLPQAWTPSSLADSPSQLTYTVVWELRLPRTLMAMLAGASLAMSGFVLQSVTRNPLADPYLFGISSGASFGAVVTLTGAFGAASLWLPIGAFVGALLAITIVIALMGRQSYRQAERMLLAGVAVSFLFSALSSGLIYGADANAIASVLFWNMGSVARVQWQQLWQPASALLIALLFFLWNRRSIEALAAGDEAAHSLGVKVAQTRIAALVMAALVTAIVVSLCGGIGFVGLVIPHLVRLLNRACGWQMSWLQHLLVSLALGAIFLVVVDAMARLILPMQELPLGVITASIGSIFFIYLLGRVRS